MSLQGKTVRIIVHEPENWDKNNLFGTIISDRGGKKLLLQLTEKIVGKEITSDIIVLTPKTENETFKPLEQYYSIMVNGNLKCNERDDEEYIIYGSVTID
ncbi:MAG: hypothetical protein IPQ10_04760 [Saprospiraceae bacterium]|nr:hypothetical protein [Saprospiraceae bacterium]